MLQRPIPRRHLPNPPKSSRRSLFQRRTRSPPKVRSSRSNPDGRLFWFYRSWFSIRPECDVSEYTARHFYSLAGSITRHPNVHADLHRSPANFLEPGVTPDRVPDPHRIQKRHAINRDRHHASFRDFPRQDRASQIHLRNQPAAKNITIAIGILRHRDCLNDKLACGLTGLVHLVRLTTNTHEFT